MNTCQNCNHWADWECGVFGSQTEASFFCGHFSKRPPPPPPSDLPPNMPDQRQVMAHLDPPRRARSPGLKRYKGTHCGCRAGRERDNCPRCEGTGFALDFHAIRAARTAVA